MSHMEIVKAGRMEVRVADDGDRVGSLLTEANLGLHTLAKARNTTRRLGSMRKKRAVDPLGSVVQTLPDVPKKRNGVPVNNKFDQVLSSIHHVSQANAILRKKLEAKNQRAALTRENLMMHEETYESNRPAIQQQKKQEFIKKELEKGRRTAAPMDEKLALLRKIDERAEKTETDRKIRADSVLGDLRKAKFRHLALMAQKRLQSVSPDVLKMEEEKEGLASRIDWYLKFCGEAEECVAEESGSGTRSPN